eukprot:UN10614
MARDLSLVRETLKRQMKLQKVTRRSPNRITSPLSTLHQFEGLPHNRPPSANSSPSQDEVKNHRFALNPTSSVGAGSYPIP